MKSVILRVLLGIVTLSLCAGIVSGCKSVYKCGDPIPEKKNQLWGKRLKEVVKERDMLCQRISSNELTIDALDSLSKSLTAENDSLKSLLDRMGSDYNALENAKLSDAERYGKALSMKTAELEQKEAELAAREKSLAELRAALAAKDSQAIALRKSVKDALVGFSDDELTVESRDGRVYVSMSNKLLFASGSATVEEKGKEALKQLAGVLSKRDDLAVTVEGHTDNDPFRVKPEVDTRLITVRDNWDLSVMRATSVVRVLTEENGLDPKRVTASGRGEYYPKADNATVEGKAMNRRTEIVLLPKLDEVMRLIN